MGIFNTLGAAVANTVSSLGNAIKTTISGPSKEQVQGTKDQMGVGTEDMQKFFSTNPRATMLDYYAYLAGKTVTVIADGGPIQGPPYTPTTTSSPFMQGVGMNMDMQKVALVGIIIVVIAMFKK